MVLLFALVTLYGSIRAQERSAEVIKVHTDLVQTSVTVVDREGKFVDGLQREQFQLKIDGKPREISFFEQVLAGSLKEEPNAKPGEQAAKGYLRTKKERLGHLLEGV